MEAAVIGTPDKRQGEVVKAIIKRKPGHELNEEEIGSFCRERLSPYKVPKVIEFVEDFPRTSAGQTQTILEINYNRAIHTASTADNGELAKNY